MATILGCTFSKWAFCLIEKFELKLTTIVNMACFVANLVGMHKCLTFDKDLIGVLLLLDMVRICIIEFGCNTTLAEIWLQWCLHVQICDVQLPPIVVCIFAPQCGTCTLAPFPPCLSILHMCSCFAVIHIFPVRIFKLGPLDWREA
jgi:hypothetical protein